MQSSMKTCCGAQADGPQAATSTQTSHSVETKTATRHWSLFVRKAERQSIGCQCFFFNANQRKQRELRKGLHERQRKWRLRSDVPKQQPLQRCELAQMLNAAFLQTKTVGEIQQRERQMRNVCEARPVFR